MPLFAFETIPGLDHGATSTKIVAGTYISRFLIAQAELNFGGEKCLR